MCWVALRNQRMLHSRKHVLSTLLVKLLVILTLRMSLASLSRIVVCGHMAGSTRACHKESGLCLQLVDNNLVRMTHICRRTLIVCMICPFHPCATPLMQHVGVLCFGTVCT